MAAHSEKLNKYHFQLAGSFQYQCLKYVSGIEGEICDNLVISG